jgi:FixJ family two-component response regulator
MSEEKKQELAAARAQAAQERRQAVENAQLAEIRSVWDSINPEDRRIFAYIEQEIPRREKSEDVDFLRETRALHFRKYRPLLAVREED